LNPGPPALEASTIPLGYRGGGAWLIENQSLITEKDCFYFWLIKEAHFLKEFKT